MEIFFVFAGSMMAVIGLVLYMTPPMSEVVRPSEGRRDLKEDPVYDLYVGSELGQYWCRYM